MAILPMHGPSEAGGAASLVRPLTRRRKKNGALYVRPAEIETGIAAAYMRPLANLAQDNAIASECLLHFARHFRPNGPSSSYEAIVTALLERVDRQVRGRIGGIPEHRRRDVRERVRDELLVRLVGGTDVLDIFECRFAMAIRTLTIDAIRHFKRIDGSEVSAEALVPAESDDSAEDVMGAILFRRDGSRMSEAEIKVELTRLRPLLTEKQFTAMVAVHYLGLKEESIDPDEVTAEKLMKITGRMVRIHLKAATEAITKHMESGQ
ncbi:hypothetical protein [Sphingopyxis sp.]|jgi:hypothetical protein|uniref:hypothetical protein n=1 Tax=Sphingopyxis sp. TaxID=1908224 RepID=UPI00261CAAE5|nr:hypothetical protein [Sphingopyxis sp.]MCW0199825.1 hypothetical protein [Sphingopyxis sp.]